MAKREEVEVGLPFGGKGGGTPKTAEQYAESYGFKALTDIETLELLADLPVDDPKSKKHPVITFNADDWAKIGYAGETVGGAQYMFNRIFDTMEISYVAKTGVSKAAKAAGKITRTIKQGENAGTEKTDIVPDILKVLRYADEFDPSMYATTRAGREGKNGIINHEDSPVGLVEAIKNWLTNVAVDLDAELVTKLGLDVKMRAMELIE